MNSRAFIGAIGDDLPSLLPLFFALMIFFSAMSFVFITIKDRNDALRLYFEAVDFSKKALGDSFFNSYDDFNKSISSIKSNRNYIVMLVKTSVKDVFSNNGIPNEDNAIKECNGKFFYNICQNENKFYIAKNKDSFKDALQRNKLYTFIYPIALATEKGNLAAYLYVFIW